ncbi:MAG: UDP-N-acetylglucosamine 1-carboxyvinyltransferase, partial [Lachnospiraceae bacterium]|nr:UDP-N-acetylglucosamine 1-carboxyvinyltransferase [Lachnospiraceae bacterium]
TYLAACLCAGDRVILRDARCYHMESVIDAGRALGAKIDAAPDGLFVEGRACEKPEKDLVTAVYPGFPTDLQSLFMSVMASTGQEGWIEETVFENRFRIVPELEKMGADIRISGNRAYVRDNGPLRNTIVEAKELRGGAALVVAALAAEGTGIVRNRHYIDRGYEDITLSLRELGAAIELA